MQTGTRNPLVSPWKKFQPISASFGHSDQFRQVWAFRPVYFLGETELIAAVQLASSSLTSPTSSPPTPPSSSLANSSSSKLLLKVYFHGGGFILYSASSTIFHDLCTNIVANIHAIIVSIDYRLIFLFIELEGRFFGHGTLDMEFKEKRNFRG